MTVSSTYETQIYVANGVATSFAWSSDYDDTFGDLIVTQVDENEQIIKTYVKGEDYFVQDKQIFFYEAPTAGTRIHLDRHTYRGQEVTFIEGEDFPAKDYETSLDRLFMIEQEQDKGLADETAARIAADEALQANIDAEEAARIAADTVLQNNIDTETAARIAADNVLGGYIDTEYNRAKTAEQQLFDEISDETLERQAEDTAIRNSIGNGTITLTQGGVSMGTFTTNQKGNTTIELNDGRLPKSVYPRYATYSSTTQAYINVAGLVEDGKKYFPIVMTEWYNNADVIQARKTLKNVCHYYIEGKQIQLDYSDNTYQSTNNTRYIFVLLPVADGTTGEQEYISGITDGMCDYLSNAQVTDNLVTSLSSSSTNTQYPSAKCVYDIVGNIETLLQSI